MGVVNFRRRKSLGVGVWGCCIWSEPSPPCILIQLTHKILSLIQWNDHTARRTDGTDTIDAGTDTIDTAPQSTPQKALESLHSYTDTTDTTDSTDIYKSKYYKI